MLGSSLGKRGFFIRFGSLPYGNSVCWESVKQSLCKYTAVLWTGFPPVGSCELRDQLNENNSWWLFQHAPSPEVRVPSLFLNPFVSDTATSVLTNLPYVFLEVTHWRVGCCFPHQATIVLSSVTSKTEQSITVRTGKSCCFKYVKYCGENNRGWDYTKNKWD